MRNWRQTVLSQFASSEKLISLLSAIDAWISPDTNFENFFNFMFNVDTAQGYGLDCWGRIVAIPRTLTLIDTTYFGFAEAGDRANFGWGCFYNGPPLTENFTLTDPVYRMLIFAKAAYNITDGSIPAINAIMMNLFPGRGTCYVTDGANGPTRLYFGFFEAGDRACFDYGPFGDLKPEGPGNMTLTYVFNFPLQPFEKAIVQCGVLPRPSGVAASWSFVN
jgi:hypothetical protein